MNLLEKFRAFMVGRYGFDQLGRFLFLLSIVFWLLSGIFRFTPLRQVYFVFWLLNTALYVWALFRIFSKNVSARSLENDRYLLLRGRALSFFERFKGRAGDRAHFYKNCPFCRTRLRLRRIRGRHSTRCPKCGREFSVLVLFGEKK